MEFSIYYSIFVCGLFIYFIWSEIQEILNADSINPIEKYGCPNCDSEYKQDIEVCADCNELNMVYKSFDKNIYY